MSDPIGITKEQFKAIRTHLGETQEQFSERLGYTTYMTVLRKENGDRPITKQDELILAPYLPLVQLTNDEENF